MTRCPLGPKKRRVSVTEKGHPGDYRNSMRGYTWKKIIDPDTGVHKGRECVNCPKRVLNPRGQINENVDDTAKSSM